MTQRRTAVMLMVSARHRSFPSQRARRKAGVALRLLVLLTTEKCSDWLTASIVSNSTLFEASGSLEIPITPEGRSPADRGRLRLLCSRAWECNKWVMSSARRNQQSPQRPICPSNISIAVWQERYAHQFPRISRMCVHVVQGHTSWVTHTQGLMRETSHLFNMLLPWERWGLF